MKNSEEKITHDELIAMINNELSQSVTPEIEAPLRYYKSSERGDEKDGRSKVVTTDVSDTIEWLMPQIMDALTANNEVCVFDPLNEGDEDQAALETEYVYNDVLMRQNNGFIELHNFIKTMLLYRNGILKVYYEDEECVKTERYTGVSDIEMQLLASRPDVQFIESESTQMIDEMGQPITLSDIVVRYLSKQPKIRVEGVPRDQFRVNSDHRSPDVSQARFAANVTTKTIGELVEAGFDYEDLVDLPESSGQNNMDFLPVSSMSADKSARLIDFGEIIMKIDYQGNGYPEMFKISCAMTALDVQKILKIEDIDSSPFIGGAAIIMPYQHEGLSIYDRIKQFQDQRTSVMRNILDNFYILNNREWLINPGMCHNVEDFMVSGAGRIKRVKNIDGAAREIVKQPLGGDAFQLLGYLDQQRAGSTGVSAEGSTAPQNIGNNVGSEGVDRLMTAKEDLVRLIIRCVAETGIRPLCIKIRDLLVRHVDVIDDYKFRGKWMQVKPKDWPPRSRCSVRVGSGTGNNRTRLAAINAIVQLQEKIAANPGTSVMISPDKIFNTLEDVCKFSGLSIASRYFLDPASEEYQQAMQSKAQQDEQAQAQQKQIQDLQNELQMQQTNAATSLASAQLQLVQAKMEADRAKALLQEEKQSSENKTKLLEEQLKQARHSADLEFKYDQLAVDLIKNMRGQAQEMAGTVESVSDAIENDGGDDGQITV